MVGLVVLLRFVQYFKDYIQRKRTHSQRRGLVPQHDDDASLSLDTIETIRGLFAQLEGYETYQRPDPGVLRKGVHDLIQRVTANLQDSTNEQHQQHGTLVLEHEALRALKAFQKKVSSESSVLDIQELLGDDVEIKNFDGLDEADVQEIFDEDFKKDLGSNVHFRRHKQTQRLALVTPSFFLMFAPPGTNTSPSKKVRFRLMRAFVVLLDHAFKAKCIQEECWRETRSRLLSFAMWIHCPFNEKDEVQEDFDEYLGNCSSESAENQDDVDDDHLAPPLDFEMQDDEIDKEENIYYFNVGRSLFCPDGYFPGPLANVFNCAKNIGNGIPSGMLQGIQHYTGLPRLKHVLKECYGWNKQRIPLDPGYTCICGYKPPRERERKNQEDFRYIVYTGQNHPGFELDNTFLCTFCSCGQYNCRLRTFFENKIQKGEDLTEEETKDYERLMEKLRSHREYVRNNPKDKETARQHNREHQIKSICNDELNKEKKQRAKFHAKPRKTTHRFEMNKGTTFQYDDPVREFVDQAFEKVVKEAGSPIVSTDLLSPVFRGVVDKYASKHPNPRTVIPLTRGGKQIYFREEMKRLAGKYMDKINERNGKRWLIRNYDTISTEEDRQRFVQSTIRGEYKYTQAGFAQYVVDSLAI